jgi:hypothetical protein
MLWASTRWGYCAGNKEALPIAKPSTLLEIDLHKRSLRGLRIAN